MGADAIDTKLKKVYTLLSVNDISPFILKVAKPDEFYQAIGRAKKVNRYGAFVEQHTVMEYATMKYLFLTTDKKAGVSVTKDGNIVSLFNYGQKKGAMKTLIITALEFGGKKLDNFNSAKLSAMYELYGFYPVSKTAFNKNFAPKDWNYMRDGQPDIRFWIHNGDNIIDVIRNIGGYDVDDDNVKEFPTYEAARKYRDKQLK